MSQPDETPSTSTPSPSPSFGIPPSTPPAGLGIEKRTSRLDYVFNFQIVVFEVEDTLFQVLRNGFNVPGTPFEAMFSLPQMETDSIEGNSLENPIHLPGIKVDHFRSFLRILYPFIDQTPVVEFDEWVGVLNLATMWLFQEIRARAITKLSDLIKKKTAMERIALAREYRVAAWLRDALLELTQKMPLDFEELRPAEPIFNSLDRNWEADVKKWEATIRDWETVARIFHLQTKVAASSFASHCIQCDGDGWGGSSSNASQCFCKCHVLAMVDEAFRGELEGLRENLGHVEHPLPPDGSYSSDSAVVRKKKGRKH